MRKSLLTLMVLAASVSSAGLAQTAMAATGEVHLEEQEWGFDDFFTGTYDRAALQRGYKVYREVCAACHSMKRIAFRHLADFGYSEAQIKNIASEYSIEDGPNEDGDMFDRSGRPSDYFPSPYPNENAAKAANGVAPPDLSLIIKARHDGANYVYGLLAGYEEPPEGKELAVGQYWNKVMPGHVIAMAAPLSDGMIAYEDETPETVDQYSRDIVEFLAWAAEPEMERRKRWGINVLIFLAAFAGLMYCVKKKIWKPVY